MTLKRDFALRTVTGITDDERQRAFDFLQGAVYCWCKNRPDEWFALRDLVGGDNTQWKGTPLLPIYNKHLHLGDEKAFEAAAIDAGWLLKRVAHEDLRLLDTQKMGMVRHYKWEKDNTETH